MAPYLCSNSGINRVELIEYLFLNNPGSKTSMFEKSLARLGLNGERGATVVGAIVAVIIAGAVGFFVVVTLLGGLPTTSFTTQQNETFASYQSNTNTAFVLIGLLALGLAATAIMGLFG